MRASTYLCICASCVLHQRTQGYTWCEYCYPQNRRLTHGSGILLSPPIEVQGEIMTSLGQKMRVLVVERVPPIEVQDERLQALLGLRNEIFARNFELLQVFTMAEESRLAFLE